MAQTIVTYCDQHLARDEHVLGETWEVSLAAPGARAATYKLDSCEDCAKPLRELLEFLGELGVRVSKKPSGAKAASPALGSGAMSTDADTPLSCPTCGHKVNNRSNLASHARQRHDMSLGELLGEETPFECPECGRKFRMSAGLNRHGAAMHPGIAMESVE